MKNRASQAAVLTMLFALTACGGGGGGSVASGPVPPGAAASPSPAPTPAAPAPSPAAAAPSVIAGTSSNARLVAVLGDGSRVAAWGDGSNVYSQRFDAAGHLVGDRLQVAASANLAGLAALASGGYVVEYQRPDIVAVQIVNAGGSPAGPPVPVHTQAQLTAEFPPDPHYPGEDATLAGGGGVFAFPDGSFAAEYLKYQGVHIPGMIPYTLYGQKFDPAGALAGSPALLRSPGSPDTVSTAPNPAGGLLVADILACPCSGAGQPLTSLFDASLQSQHATFGATPGNNLSPSAAGLPGGNYVMVWTAAGTASTPAQVQGQVFTADPTVPYTGTRPVTPLLTFANAASGARVIALSDGRFLLTWHGGAQAFDAGGRPASAVLQTLDGHAAATPDGGFVVLAQVGGQLVEQAYPAP